jgi:hypothetical protein
MALELSFVPVLSSLLTVCDRFRLMLDLPATRVTLRISHLQAGG